MTEEVLEKLVDFVKQLARQHNEVERRVEERRRSLGNSIQDAKGVLCGTTRCQLPNYQILFVKQHFGTSGRVGHLVGHTKLPSLMAKSD